MALEEKNTDPNSILCLKSVIKFVKVLSFEFGAIILTCILMYFIYSQNKKIQELEDTIIMQDEAIKQQNFLLHLQSYMFGRQ